MQIEHIGRVPRAPVIALEGMGETAVAGVDFDQWTPPYLMLGAAIQGYVREHLVADGRDPRRMTIVAKHAFRLWGPETNVLALDRPKNREYIATRQAEGAKGSTIRRELALIQAAINHNVREQRLKEAPKFLKPKAGTPRLRWLTRDEYKRLIAQPMEYRIKLFLLLAFGTGARSFAIEELRWSQVNFETRLIDYKRPGAVYRNKKRAIVPISDALLPRLETAYARRKDDFVIGAGGCTYRKVKAVMRSIGIDEEGVARHVARHTFASWLLQAGVPSGRSGVPSGGLKSSPSPCSHCRADVGTSSKPGGIPTKSGDSEMATFKVGQRVKVVRVIDAPGDLFSLIGQEGVILRAGVRCVYPDDNAWIVYLPQRAGRISAVCGPHEWNCHASEPEPLSDPKADQFIESLKKLAREPQPDLQPAWDNA